jgi:hypothetical protein
MIRILATPSIGGIALPPADLVDPGPHFFYSLFISLFSGNAGPGPSMTTSYAAPAFK